MQALKVAPRRAVAAKAAFTMQGLRRTSLWGAAAAATLLVAVLAGGSEVGSQRASIALSALIGRSAAGPNSTLAQGGAHPFDAQAETHRLAEAVRTLGAENDRLKSKLAALEHSVNDITGSIARQNQNAKTDVVATPWPAETPPVPATPELIGSAFAPSSPRTNVPVVPLTSSPPPAITARPVEVGPTGDQAAQYAVDIGSALSISALRVRWLRIHAAHTKLFESLTPAVTLRETPRDDHVELRLIVGPLANAEAAAELCKSLAHYQLFCEPTIFDRQRLALQ